jgi:hypothetical protein
VADLDLDTHVDTDGTVHVREHNGWKIQIIPMIFNDRLVLSAPDDVFGYSHGWCFDKGGAAILAALAWDLDTEDEPAGFKKRATPGLRFAPHRVPDSGHRCVHGQWYDCGTVDCPGGDL